MEIKLKNKGYIFFVLSFALFGLAGMFLVPVVILIIKYQNVIQKFLHGLLLLPFL